MAASCFSCVFLICIAVSHGYHSNIDFKPKNGSMLNKITNDNGTSSAISNTEFFDKEQKIIAHKNEITNECVVKLEDDQANILNFKNNYDQNMELTEDEMVEIIGENLRNFCKDKIIILNNFDNKRFSRSKRSTDKKRYQGQTQTQFVSFGSKNYNQETKNGLAEALSQPDLSRATVSGLNGMGQAQSQSSFGECDECSGQDYRTHSTHVYNSHPGHFPSLPPIISVPQNQNSRPYSGPNTNMQSPGLQNEENQREHSINGHYPNTYPGTGTNDKLPGNQAQGYGVRPLVDGQYPGSGTNNKLSGNQDQGYGVTPSIDGQYTGSGTNNKLPGNQDQGYGISPSIDGKYPSSGTNDKLPGNQAQGYGVRPLVDGQYPGSGTNNKLSGNQDQGYGVTPSIDGQNAGSGTNNKLPGNQDQGYGISPSIDGKYSSSGTNDKLPGNQAQGYGNVPSLYGQYPGKNEGSESNNNTELDNLDSRRVYSSANEQNTNSPESKKTVNNGVINPNTYSINSSPFNPDSWGYPNKINNNNPNIDQQINSDGSGFLNVPSGLGHEILTPHYTPNSEWTRPSYNPQVPGTTSIEHQNKPSNSPSSFIPNYQQQTPNVLGQLAPNKPISSDMNSQNEQRIKNEAAGTVQNGYPLSSNIQGRQDYTTLNLPSLCNFLYQTCLNALSNNKRLNEFQIINSQNNERIPNERKQVGITQVPTAQQQGYPLYGGGNNQNQIQPSFGLPRDTLESGEPSVQHPGYAAPGGNVNQIQPSYGQHQGTLGSGGIGVQQPGYAPLGENINPIQPSYGQPQGTFSSGKSGYQQPGYVLSGGNINQIQPQNTLGSGGSGFQRPGYVPSGGNVNQMQHNYGQPQGTLGYGGPSFQQPGYVSSAGNINQVQPSYSQPQGTFGFGKSGYQQPGYVPSGGNVNQIQHNYGQPQGTLGSRESGFQQPGYTPSGGNINPLQPTYGQPQGTLGSGGPGVQQPGYAPSDGNRNKIQSSYGLPQGALGSGGFGIQQPGYTTSGENTNQIQPSYGQHQGTLGFGGSGVQQPGYAPSGGNINKIQPSYGQPQGALDSGRSGVQPPGYTTSGENINQIQPSYSQNQGTLGSGGTGVQLPGYAPSGGNTNKIQPSYGQPQGALGSGGSGVQQPGYNPSGGSTNQIQPSYGQPQGTLGSGGFGFQQPGYVPSGGYVNQMQPNYGKPQGSLGSGGPGVQQPGYHPLGGNINQIQPSYGQPQNTLGSGGTRVQQHGYNSPPDRSGVIGVQSPLDGKRVPQSYPESYGDNSLRGPSLKPGSEMGNINPSPNPIIGGQFGTDISSGGSVTLIDTEGGDAQSMTNVDVDGQETRASASAQGKSKTGMSQTQVSGSYLGTGSFSAQAQTSDSDKGAQSQIVSNTNGTTSTAQGKGGRGQAQSQVLYNADNGIALGEAQSSGINYGTNTQLQAGIKGGVADAQSTGPGSTSSQAQIGFLPHDSNNSTNQKSLFKGGGATSAQSGSYSGQSQSQLFGSYKHGISYNGAAQASTGKKLQNLPKLNVADAKLKIEQLEGSNNEVKNQTNAPPKLQSIPNLNYQNQKENSKADTQKQQNISLTQAPSILPQELSKNIDVYPEYEDNDEYDEDSDETVNTKSVQTKKETIPKQEQNIILKLDDKHDAQITRDSDSQLKSGQVLDAGQVIPGTNGTKIPNGFRGRVASVAGDLTEAKAIPGGQAQTQTVYLTPGVGSLTVVDKTKLRAQLNKESYVKPINSFKSEINGGIGKFRPDEKNVQYFTKSSTCGYFSFSCNYVNGAKDGPKICKPNPPPFPCQKTNN